MKQEASERMLSAYFRSIDRTQDARDRHQELMLAVAAGEPLTLFGEEVQITLTFPNRIPLGQASIEEFQALMREWLAKHREQMKRLAERLT